MRYERSILRTLGLVVLLSCTQLAFTSDSSLPQPVATLDIAEILPKQKDLTFTTVAFSSDTTIEVIACPTVRRDTTCPAAVFRWENAVLEHVAQMPEVRHGEQIIVSRWKENIARFQRQGCV
jgi:hypothetical protein